MHKLSLNPRGQSTQATAIVRDPPNITWTHSWPLDKARIALEKSLFLNLPVETVLEIFKHLSVKDLGNVSLVCRFFKMIADNDDIWKLKFMSSGKIPSKTYKQIYIEWIYEKYLRNIELNEVEEAYMIRSMGVACGMRCMPPHYPIRPEGNHQFIPIREFKQHPNESATITIDLSVDIDKTAPELLSLLEKASKFKEEWRQSHIIQQMITRYYRFMRLKATCPANLILIPTLDIEIVWQTHLLRPQMYHDDCMRLFHRVIDHRLITNEIEQFLKRQAFIDTCKLYNDKYGEQYCPLPAKTHEKDVPKKPKYVHHVFGRLECLIPNYFYWDETHYTFQPNKLNTDFENPFSFTQADIILDGNWLDLCKRFMNESLNAAHIRSYFSRPDEIRLGPSAIQRLKKSYERFLYMSTKYSPNNGYSFVHPTYAIDIIWHSHMQEPLKYESDCNRLVGLMIDHAPWPHVDHNQMTDARNEMTDLWKKEFQIDMLTDHLYNTVTELYNYSDD